MAGISNKIFWDFNQIQIGMESFMTDIEKKMHEIIPDLPVFILQTGDASYYVDKKFQEITNKEIYEKVPRFHINFEDISILSDQNTNPYNNLEYKYKGKIYCCTARRLAIQVPLNMNFVSSNFLKALEHFEVMGCLVCRPNVFTYDFLGNTFEAAYVHTGNSSDAPTLDPSNATRNYSIKFQWTLDLQLLLPRVETIKELSTKENVKTRFSIKDRVTLDTSTIEKTD